jgi:endoglucanase
MRVRQVACMVAALVAAPAAVAMAQSLEEFRAMPDNRLAVRTSFGVRSARPLAADQVELVIGMSVTDACQNPAAYRVVSFDDDAYAYEKFVAPTEAKSGRELEVQGVEGCRFGKFERTVVTLKLPSSMREGATYHVIAQGVGGTMVTGAHSAQSFLYKPGVPSAAAEEAVNLAVLGLRRVESVGEGILRLEFGPDFSPEAGSKLENYRVTVGGAEVRPKSFGRIARIDTYLPVGWPFAAIPMHEVFLQLPQRLQNGAAVAVAAGGNVTTAASTASMAYHDLKTVSGSIKVNQVGYIADSPVKVAYLGRWMGSFPQQEAREAAGAGDAEAAFFEAVAGKKEAAPAAPPPAASPALRFGEEPPFAICEEATGRKVLEGTCRLVHASGTMDEGVYKCDHSGENVYTIDFGRLQAPGRYFVSVAGVGRSLAFDVAPDVYNKAFQVQAYGVFAQRCGIELKPPWSPWRRIACHTKGVVPTTQLRLDKHDIVELAKKVDYERSKDAGLPEAMPICGGHHDAGDYNPRSHYEVAQALMDAYEIAPQKFFDGQLSIPESRNGIPDILDEAGWAMQLWMGLQDEDGGVFDGTESDGDPNFIQTVELDPRGDFAYAKDACGSLTFAGFMAQASRIWRSLGRDKEAGDWLDRARRAYEWAMKNPPKPGRDASLYGQAWLNPKAYAAAELLHTTGEKRFNDDFLAACVWAKNPAADLSVYGLYDQSRAAWAYATCPAGVADARLQTAARGAIQREADLFIQHSSTMAYRFIRHPWAPISWGTGAYENSLTSTLWAWKLTGQERYREWMIRTCDNTLGANPPGLCYITGLGSRTIHAPLHNSRYSHFGEVAAGQQVQGPNQRGEGYGVAETAFPRLRESFASLYTFTDSHFAISMDEGTVVTQARSMAAFGLLLPDRK